MSQLVRIGKGGLTGWVFSGHLSLHVQTVRRNVFAFTTDSPHCILPL